MRVEVALNGLQVYEGGGPAQVIEVFPSAEIASPATLPSTNMSEGVLDSGTPEDYDQALDDQIEKELKEMEN